jgi:O-antigen/teichoic acid export membrane protein
VIPQITKSYSGGDRERAMDLVVFTSKYSFFLILFPSIPILLETDAILGLWLKKVPLGTSLFVQLFVLNAIIASMNAGIPAVIQATGKIKYFQIILSSLSLIGLPISYFLFKQGFPSYTLSIVYLIIAVVNFVVLQFLLKRILKFDIIELFRRIYLKMFVVCFSILPLFCIQFFIEPSFMRFCGVTALSILWLLLAIYFFGMSEVEKNNINKIMIKYCRIRK